MVVLGQKNILDGKVLAPEEEKIIGAVATIWATAKAKKINLCQTINWCNLLKQSNKNNNQPV